jgi:hypothetical protein
MLLWCFDIVDYRKKRTKGAIFTPLLHKSFLLRHMLVGVVVSVFIPPKEQCLPNEIDRVRAAAEASLRRLEVAKVARYSCDRGVVVVSVI